MSARAIHHGASASIWDMLRAVALSLRIGIGRWEIMMGSTSRKNNTSEKRSTIVLEAAEKNGSQAAMEAANELDALEAALEAAERVTIENDQESVMVETPEAIVTVDATAVDEAAMVALGIVPGSEMARLFQRTESLRASVRTAAALDQNAQRAERMASFNDEHTTYLRDCVASGALLEADVAYIVIKSDGDGPTSYTLEAKTRAVRTGKPDPRVTVTGEILTAHGAVAYVFDGKRISGRTRYMTGQLLDAAGIAHYQQRGECQNTKPDHECDNPDKRHVNDQASRQVLESMAALSELGVVIELSDGTSVPIQTLTDWAE